MAIRHPQQALVEIHVISGPINSNLSAEVRLKRIKAICDEAVKLSYPEIEADEDSDEAVTEERRKKRKARHEFDRIEREGLDRSA